MVICGVCGSENEDGATRCVACDAPLPSAATPAPRGEAPPARHAPTVVGQLAEPSRRVAAGHEAIFTLDVRNEGPTADHLRIEVMGDAAAWAAVDPPAFDLLPGASTTVAVRLRPPHPGAGTETIDFALAIHSAEHPDATAMEFGVLEIGPPAADAAVAGATRAAGGEAGRRRVPPLLAAVAAVALVVVAAGVIAVGGPALGPESPPAAAVTASPAATPAPTTTASPLVPPTAGATLVPVSASLDPGAPAAWWQDAYDAATAAGVDLGAAVAEGTTAESLPYAEFTNGAVVQRVYDAYWLSDEIWRAWKALGGGPGPAADLGYPASSVLGPSLAERRQLFDDGAIYWTAATGAHGVGGVTWAWWRTLVRERGGDVEQPSGSGLIEPLGHPTSDVRSDATGSWIELEGGMLGVTGDGNGWACAYAGPANGFPSCADVGRTDPRPSQAASPPATPVP